MHSGAHVGGGGSVFGLNATHTITSVVVVCTARQFDAANAKDPADNESDIASSSISIVKMAGEPGMAEHFINTGA